MNRTLIGYMSGMLVATAPALGSSFVYALVKPGPLYADLHSSVQLEIRGSFDAPFAAGAIELAASDVRYGDAASLS